MTIVSSFLTFPCTSWWAQAQKADTIVFDSAEYFQKMSYRNRYRVAGANNSILLSLPLVNGRNQRTPMASVDIYNQGRWQTQHWRSLVSVYNRSPFFGHYELGLKPLFETQYSRLVDFNMQTILWAKRQLKLGFEIQETDVYIKQYPPDITDLRNIKDANCHIPAYHQVFEDRIGFLPGLSILDLLFSEGPAAASLLEKTK